MISSRFQVNLRLILVSGNRADFLVSPSDSVTSIVRQIFDKWPKGKSYCIIHRNSLWLLETEVPCHLMVAVSRGNNFLLFGPLFSGRQDLHGVMLLEISQYPEIVVVMSQTQWVWTHHKCKHNGIAPRVPSVGQGM